MRAQATRLRVVSENIANADTPGFKAKDVKFEGMLQEALERTPGLNLRKTNPRHIEGGSGVEVLTSNPEVVTEPSSLGSFDGNSVSVDQEMYKLNENSLLYQVETDILARLFAGVKFNVTDGGA